VRVSNWGLSPGDDCHVALPMDRPGWTPDPPVAKAALIDVVPHQMSLVIGTLGPRPHHSTSPRQVRLPSGLVSVVSSPYREYPQHWPGLHETQSLSGSDTKRAFALDAAASFSRWMMRSSAEVSAEDDIGRALQARVAQFLRDVR
jgi:hypothetical protein